MRAAACLLALLGLLPAGPGLSAPQTWRTHDGAISVTGEPLAAAPGMIRVQSVAGPVDLDPLRLRCVAGPCPDGPFPLPPLRLAAEPDLARLLLPGLVDGFARSLGAGLDQVPGPGGSTLWRLRGEGGVVLAELAVTPGADWVRALAGGAELAFSTRRAGAEEADFLLAAGLPEAVLLPRLIGRDGLVPQAAAAEGTPTGPARLKSMAILGMAEGPDLALTCGRSVAPGPEAVRDGTWPHVRPLLLSFGATEPGLLARRLAAFAAGPEGQAIVADAGFTDLGPAPGDPALSTLLPGALRLLPPFLLRPNGEPEASLDEVVLFLVDSLPPRDGEILVLGFTDPLGPAGANLRLSRLWAERLAARIAALPGAPDPARFPIRAMGLGEAYPLACADTPAARRQSRRVEIWYRAHD